MSAVFASIVKHANTLVENQHGNYIIQHLLDLGPKNKTDTIGEKMHGELVAVMSFFKCLRHSSQEMKEGNALKDWRRIIIKGLLTKARDLTSDKNGNYCLHANDVHILEL